MCIRDSYMVRSFMGGEWGRYVWHTYLAAIWMTGFYFYAASLYILTSLFACLLSRTRYVRLAVLAYLVSSVICALSFWRVWDEGNLRLGAALFAGGAGYFSRVEKRNFSKRSTGSTLRSALATRMAPCSEETKRAAISSQGRSFRTSPAWAAAFRQ